MADKMRAIVEFERGGLPKDLLVVGHPGPVLTCLVSVDDDTGKCVYATRARIEIGASIARDLREGIIGTAENVIENIARDLTEDRPAAEDAGLGDDSRRFREALEEILRREARSEYTSIHAAPGEFAQIARKALGHYG